ncbi:hypothetical protein M758_12G173000 [Ceratodon purpureus]|nr:hypothetical protein KC19_12G169900 [Ceratodon purpureus]KAG0555447.1 hypothetical protein KC19_12G169900 [Ceratodon purpureus]KAG0555448.1 hypothetical protein KC19_12G169900 [Ceratodon purpureus]KAG0599703.1 hypothetical protein M758_12G173000 [Ceratodon purpureus]
MAQESVQAQVKQQRLRNFGFWMAFIVVFSLLHLGAKEARKQLGDEIASKTGKDDFGDCLDMGFGSLTCAVKQGSKMYTNNFRASIVEHTKQRAYHVALQSAISDGLAMSEAARKAQQIADIAAKVKKEQARRIIGPVFAAVWDGLEVLYYGGSFAEVSIRATGTLCGTWWGGILGEDRLGKVGYLIGTQVGSWAGSRIALMTYDIVKAIQLITLEVKEFVTGEDENEDVGKEAVSEEYITENAYQSSPEESANEYSSSDESGSGWFSGSDDENPPSDEL